MTGLITRYRDQANASEPVVEKLEIKEELEFFRTNPNAVQRYVLELLEESTGGQKIIPDPGNPFVFLLEATASLASTAMNECRSRVRELYPSLSNKPEDIYRHMSDVDYLGQFYTPSKCEISLVFALNDILTHVVDLPLEYYKKIVIPKDSIFTLGEYNFGFYYPIEIRITAENGIQVVYDITQESPLKRITDDRIEYSIFSYNGIDYISIQLPMEQFNLTSFKRPVNANIGFNQKIDFNDNYYYCRVYSKVMGDWRELITTHSKEIFDITEPTAQLTVLENQLVIKIPQIYITNGSVAGEVRIDIYTTLGDIELNLGNFSNDSSSYKWRDLDMEENNIFSAPLGKISNVGVFSTSITSGGGDGEDFEQIRNRVINTRSARTDNIRLVELETKLATLNYQLVKSIDNITDRIFLAAKQLPTYSDKNVAISGSNEIVQITEGEMDSALIIKNENSYTFLHNGLFKIENEVIRKLSDEEESKIYSLEQVELVNYLNNNRIYYNPFHYSLDKSKDFLTFVPYFLTNPNLTNRKKIGEVTSIDYRIESQSIKVEYIKEGYRILVSTRSNSKIKELPDSGVHLQLSFIPKDDNRSTFLNGNLMGKAGDERVFEFILESTLDIDRDDYILFNNFTKSEDDDSFYRVNLNGDFILSFSITGVDDILINEGIAYNSYLGRHLLPENPIALTIESLIIRMGESLPILYSGSRTSTEDMEYEVYETDVPYIYTKAVYERDDDGILVLEDDPVTGNRVPKVIHEVGDEVLDEDGNPKIRFKKGDIKLVDGEPVIIQDRGRRYFLNILLINSIYKFSTVLEQQNAFKEIPVKINNYLKNELEPFSQEMFERTELYYVPKKTSGIIEVFVGGEGLRSVNSAQKIAINYFMNETNYVDEQLVNSITEATFERLLDWLDQRTISISMLIHTLTNELGNSILGVEIKWLGELEGVEIITLIDSSYSISVAQELTINFDQDYEVVEGIELTFSQQLN